MRHDTPVPLTTCRRGRLQIAWKYEDYCNYYSYFTSNLISGSISNIISDSYFFGSGRIGGIA